MIGQSAPSVGLFVANVIKKVTLLKFAAQPQKNRRKQINDVNSKFKDLQELFQNNWTGTKTNFSCKQKKEGLAAERGSSSQCCENHRDWCSVKGASKAMQCKGMKNTLRPTSGSFEQLNKTSSRRICSTSVKKSLVEESELIKKVKSDVRNGKISHA
ncbi:uncharacterized protein LOC124788778 [Schistocerca piceifrons]|uniref:uncharacterized protein LOC124788778 n=1 Tax=Schistocerca piceifrons TaxID=274613 RepID=UPI001F5F85A5|nr:uncharacterized protein LOC124788778 [Schistocerca piceifrons]